VIIRRVLDWIYWHLIYLTTSNTALSLIYTLYKSLGHAKPSQSSLVVSWQRIYNSLSPHSLIPFLPFILNYSANCQPRRFSQFCFRVRVTSLYSFGADPQKTPFLKNSFIVWRCRETCLPSICLAMTVSSGSTIPAFRRHIIILYYDLSFLRSNIWRSGWRRRKLSFYSG
jgi:hypothetical protein